MRDESEKEGDLDKNVERKNCRKVFEREERKKENILKHYSSHRSCLRKKYYVEGGKFWKEAMNFIVLCHELLLLLFFFLSV